MISNLPCVYIIHELLISFLLCLLMLVHYHKCYLFFYLYYSLFSNLYLNLFIYLFIILILNIFYLALFVQPYSILFIIVHQL